MILCENCVMLLFLALFHVNKCVARPGHQHCRCTLIEWIVGDLEVADGTLDIALAPNTRLRYQLLTIPIPQENLPIGLASQRHDHFLVLGAESACDELL